MNNGEYLNTLNNNDKAREINIESQIPANTRNWLKWLNSPHETTADEDFAEIGFSFNEKEIDYAKEEFLSYEDKHGRLLFVNEKSGNEYTHSEGDESFSDKLIDQIRKAADKKRKEMGWPQ